MVKKLSDTPRKTTRPSSVDVVIAVPDQDDSSKLVFARLAPDQVGLTQQQVDDRVAAGLDAEPSVALADAVAALPSVTLDAAYVVTLLGATAPTAATGTIDWTVPLLRADNTTVTIGQVSAQVAIINGTTTPTPVPPGSPTLTIQSVSPLTAGATATAEFAYANGKPATTITATLGGSALTLASVVVDNITSGSGATAAGTGRVTFTQPAAGTRNLVLTSTGTYAATSAPFSVVTAAPAVTYTVTDGPYPISTNFSWNGNTYTNVDGMFYINDGTTNVIPFEVFMAVLKSTTAPSPGTAVNQYDNTNARVVDLFYNQGSYPAMYQASNFALSQHSAPQAGTYQVWMRITATEGAAPVWVLYKTLTASL